jgi:hypothetical protein
MFRAIPFLFVWAGVVLTASFARAQAGAPSDILDEVIIDQHGNTINHPISISIPQGTPANPEGGIVVTVPPLTIDFHNPNDPTGQNISDRLHIDSYQVTVRSDDETGLAPRSGSTFIPVAANERFLPVSILTHSDGESTAGANSESDHLHIVQGFYSGQPAALIKVFADVGFAEPVPEGPDMPPRFDFAIPPSSYDVAQATTGTNSVISDYLDHSQITGYFISSDNQADYNTALPIDGIVLEDGLFATDPNGPNPFYGGDFNFALRFSSDTEVPEPGSIVLLALGLGLVAVRGRTRLARQRGPTHAS